MGDANYDRQRNRVRIYTNSFTQNEVQRLAEAIFSKFGIYTGVLLDRKNQYILTVGAKELPKLQVLVAPYIHPSLLYRINMVNGTI